MRKHSFLLRIRILMCAGALLLCVGIWRWLHAEYTSAEQELQKSLFGAFMHAEMRMTDTILTQKVIAPILEDTAGFKISMESDVIDTLDAGHQKMRFITSDSFVTKELAFSNVYDTLHHDSISLSISNDSGDVMFRGIRLFISELEGPDGMHTMLERYISQDDTLLLQKYFAENLDSADLPLTPIWIHTAHTKDFPPAAFTYHAKAFDMPFGVRIEKYKPYLYKKLWPQGVFSLFLLMCIVTAFLVAYRSLKKQMELSAIKDDLISNISHELKTPVATVRVALEAMQSMDQEELQGTMPRYMEMATSELDRLEMLINKVMQSATWENGIPDMQTETFDAVALLDTILPGMITQAQMRNATLRFTKQVEHALIHFDTVHFRGILFNLIDNAIKYGGEQPLIEVVCAMENKQFKIQVRDNGPGIPKEYADKIFEKFFRVPQGDKHNVKGHGLGLYYIAQVLAHGDARISHTSVPEGGSLFTLTFDTLKI